MDWCLPFIKMVNLGIVDPITNLPTTRHHLQQRIPGSQRFTHFGVRGPKGLVTGRPRPSCARSNQYWWSPHGCFMLHVTSAICCIMLLLYVVFSLRRAFPCSTWNIPVASTWHLYAPKETTWCLSTWLNYCFCSLSPCFLAKSHYNHHEVTLKNQIWIAKSLLSPH